MNWYALIPLLLGAALMWGSIREDRSDDALKEAQANADIRGVAPPAPRNWLRRVLGQAFAQVSGHLGLVLILLGIVGLIA
ncbi:hypothetical protein ERY430_40456 [Erythrobacter sp. EC-HK427]|nr:hypothetical protein ERY430_40456 [Erythrobacter sp. EC-HK427]